MPPTVTLPPGFTVRHPTLDDVAAALQVINACEIADSGAPDYTLDDLRAEWAGLDLAQDAWLITAPDGTPAATITVDDRGQGRIDSDGYVHPGYRGRGLGAALLRLAEDRARALIPDAPPEARVMLTSTVMAQDAAAHDLLAQAGFALVRHFWRMTITLEAPPPAPVWPAGVTVRPFAVGQDEHAVYALLQTAFADHWGFVPAPFERWAAHHYDHPTFDPAATWLAWEGVVLAGVAENRTYPDLGWVGSLGILRAWRGRGLGLALLRQSFAAFYARERPVVELAVDAGSLTGATRLYERAGMRVKEQYDRHAKELRPGVDLTIQVAES